ncbi:MAG: hypothetical protein FJ138_18625, partial [Deltaproteobacteria bacterium]|nr:hypothetical protein [Deltaproteobacteria bacterium]
MDQKQKVIEFSKRLLIHVATNALPGSVQLLMSAAQDFHELFLAAPPEERAALLEGARALSDAELTQARAEIARDTGLDDPEAADLVLQTLRGVRGAGDAREVLRSVNATLGAATRGEATIAPRAGRARTTALATALG